MNSRLIELHKDIADTIVDMLWPMHIYQLTRNSRFHVIKIILNPKKWATLKQTKYVILYLRT